MQVCLVQGLDYHDCLTNAMFFHDTLCCILDYQKVNQHRKLEKVDVALSNVVPCTALVLITVECTYGFVYSYCLSP